MTAFYGGQLLGVDVDAFSSNTSPFDLPLGTCVMSSGGGKTYRYVRFVDAVTYVKGHVCSIASATQFDVTNDVSGGSALAGLWPVGVLEGDGTTVPTQNQTGFVQISGIATIIAGSAAVIAGDLLKPDAATDGASDEATAGTHENIVGVAMATIADTASGNALLALRG